MTTELRVWLTAALVVFALVAVVGFFIVVGMFTGEYWCEDRHPWCDRRRVARIPTAGMTLRDRLSTPGKSPEWEGYSFIYAACLRWYVARYSGNLVGRKP